MTKNVGFLGDPAAESQIESPSVAKRLTAEVRRRVEGIKFLILDIDGVLTDGRLFYHDDGTESKAFDVRDGHGIKLIQRAGIKVALISGRSSPSVEKRAADLGIETAIQGVKDKVPVFEKLIREEKVTAEQVAFVGDDLVDLPVMRRVGLAVAVADASEHLFKTAHYVTLARGGRGAVREVIELILAVQGLWPDVATVYFENQRP